MITTVSTTTVTTVTAIAAMGLTVALGAATAVVLALSLTTKELASAGKSGFSQRVAKFLNISIIPLVLAFIVTVGIKVIEVIR